MGAFLGNPHGKAVDPGETCFPCHAATSGDTKEATPEGDTSHFLNPGRRKEHDANFKVFERKSMRHGDL